MIGREEGRYQRMPWSRIYQLLGEKGWTFAEADNMTLLEAYHHLGATIKGMAGVKVRRSC